MAFSLCFYVDGDGFSDVDVLEERRSRSQRNGFSTALWWQFRVRRRRCASPLTTTNVIVVLIALYGTSFAGLAFYLANPATPFRRATFGTTERMSVGERVARCRSKAVARYVMP